tara:strand:+ start:190 stop:543 length:354 start_codon:yes stop_codon:yes gene_type:complete
MKFSTKILTTSFLILLLYSCAAVTPQPTYEEKMQTWIGEHYSKMIQQWGAYTRSIDDGAGGTIYIWEKPYSKSSTTTPYTAFGKTYYSTSGGGSGVSFHDVFVDKDGKIVRIKWGKR